MSVSPLLFHHLESTPVTYGGTDDRGIKRSHEQSEDVRKQARTFSPKFACPVAKHSNFYNTASCSRMGYRSISRLKEHLLRKHEQRKCDRCRKNFTSTVTLNAHKERCDEVKYVASEDEGLLLRGEVLEEIRRRTNSRQDDATRWIQLYKLIFPDATEIPSPYADDLIDSCPLLISIQDFTQTIQDAISNRFLDSDVKVEDALEVIREIINDAVNKYISKRVPETKPEASPPSEEAHTQGTTSVSGGNPHDGATDKTPAWLPLSLPSQPEPVSQRSAFSMAVPDLTPVPKSSTHKTRAPHNEFIDCGTSNGNIPVKTASRASTFGDEIAPSCPDMSMNPPMKAFGDRNMTCSFDSFGPPMPPQTFSFASFDPLPYSDSCWYQSIGSQQAIWPHHDKWSDYLQYPDNNYPNIRLHGCHGSAHL